MNRKIFGIFVIFTLIIALLITAGEARASANGSPLVSLSADQAKYSAAQDVLITATISNPTGHSLRILKWFTPADGLEEPILKVSVNGRSVSYTGAVYKRPAPTGSDYITLKSGESVTFTIPLGEYYDLSATGRYEIAYAAASPALFNEKGKAVETLSSSKLVLEIKGRSPKVKPTPPPPPPDGGSSFTSCSVTQQAILNNAREGAIQYASGADAYLQRINSGTERYVEWFGVFDSSRYNIVADHFVAIDDAWVNAGVNFDCKCKQPYYAYVYPDKPYYIYLCKVFWQAPLTGTDSQAGTLIHEMSHFNVVAQTDDYVYGQTGAINLAITNPAQAIMNADNHEYFAENNPALP